jgi:membrane fusion protein, heavy metal efflux system
MASTQNRGSVHHWCRRVTVASLLMGGLATHAIAEPPQIPVTDSQARSLGIRVVHPIASRTDQTLAFPAQIVIPTVQLWVVSAPVAGLVESLAVARGDHVMRGQIIATMQSPNFVSLQRDYLHAVEQQVLLDQQLRRNANLADTQALAKRVLEASQTEARQANVAVAERRQMLRLAGMSDEAISHLTDEAAITAELPVKAPEDGTVTEVAVSPGMRLDQSAPILKVARLSPVWAEVAVPASSVQAIRVGARVDIDGYDQPGHVLLVSETIDAPTQTVLVRAEMPNNGLLRPGQTVGARLSFLSAGETAWEIPDTALVRRGEMASVFVKVAGGFRSVPVTVLAEDVDHVVVSGKITGQDEVAAGGVSALRGMLVGLGAGG